MAEVETLLDYGGGISALMKSLPHVPKRTLEEYMAIAVARAQDENAARREARRPFALRRAYAQLRQLLIERDPPSGPKPDQRTKASIDLNVARVEERIARLEGTYAPEVLKVIKRTGWEDLTDDELDEFQRTGIPPARVNAEDLLRLH